MTPGLSQKKEAKEPRYLFNFSFLEAQTTVGVYFELDDSLKKMPTDLL